MVIFQFSIFFRLFHLRASQKTRRSYENCYCEALCEWNFKKMVRSKNSSIGQRECDQPGPFPIIHLEVTAIWKWGLKTESDHIQNQWLRQYDEQQMTDNNMMTIDDMIWWHDNSFWTCQLFFHLTTFFSLTTFFQLDNFFSPCTSCSNPSTPVAPLPLIQSLRSPSSSCSAPPHPVAPLPLL